MRRMRSQRGATLLVALIMLVLLTLFAISALNTSTTNLKVVGNMQARTEAQNAAQQAIETVISSTLFTTNPAGAVLSPCDAGANTLCINAAGSVVPNAANALYTVQLNPQPTCVMVRALTNNQAYLEGAPGCLVAPPQGSFAIGGAAPGNSLCADSIWDITAESVAAVSGAKVALTQGVGIRISVDEMNTSCL